MPGNLSSLIAAAFMFGGCAVAATISTGRARTAAAALTVAMALSLAAQKLSGGWTPSLALTLIDMTLLVVFLAIAWKPPGAWPVVMVALQGLIVAIDGVKLAEPRMQAYAYASAVILASYALVITILVGAWSSRWWRR